MIYSAQMSVKMKDGVQSKPPGIREIAANLGISIGTVSRSINQRYGVNPKTRDLVLAEARRIGYVPNHAARQLKDHPTLEVGFFFSPFRGASGEINPAALNTIEAFEKRVNEAGMAFKVFFYTNRPDEFHRQLQSVNVAVFYGHFDKSIRPLVHESGVPAILLQQYPSEYENQIALRADTHHVGSAGVEYLAALGHERIAIVLASLTEQHSCEMLKGYREALKEFALPEREDWICELPPALSNNEGGAQAMARLMGLSPRPTAVMFASDWMAAGALRMARDLHLRVPEDVSLIGYDNLPIASEIDPQLTTFDVHLDKEVETLLQMVEDIALNRGQLKRPHLREVLLIPDLIRRHSCACLRQRKNQGL